MGKIKDMSGQFYKNWKILNICEQPPTKNSSSSTWWNCECVKCGQQKPINGAEIRANRAGACRCNSKKKHKQSQLEKQMIPARVKNETGNCYGKLKVLSFAYTKNSHAYWKCICECGTESIVKGNALRTGAIQSCGCQRSRKEEEIRFILENNNIDFIREYTFSDLKDKGYLRFDFALFSTEKGLLGLIEYQGQQHYDEYCKYNHFGLLQRHDTIKLKYCENNQIPLLILNKDNDLNTDILNWYKSLF